MVKTSNNIFLVNANVSGGGELYFINLINITVLEKEHVGARNS